MQGIGNRSWVAGVSLGGNALLKWLGEEVCFCMAAPGDPRPGDFTCAAGSGRTFSQWRLKK